MSVQGTKCTCRLADVTNTLMMRCHKTIGGNLVHNPTDPYHNRPVRDCEHELISYSEWATEADIAAYLDSAAHKEILHHARSLKGSKAVVKLYDLVE